MIEIPSYSIDLIKLLDKYYPEKAPDPKDSERQIWMKAGKRELVRNLVQIQKSAEDDKYKEEIL